MHQGEIYCSMPVGSTCICRSLFHRSNPANPSLVHPWCLLGASLVPPRCLPGASLQPLTWSQAPVWTPKPPEIYFIMHKSSPGSPQTQPKAANTALQIVSFCNFDSILFKSASFCFLHAVCPVSFSIFDKFSILFCFICIAV